MSDPASDAAEASREYSRRYRAEHPDEIKAYRRKYNAQHRAALSESKRKYRAEHAGEIKAYQRTYNAAHRAEITAYERSRVGRQRERERKRAERSAREAERTRQWRLKNPERYRERIQRYRLENPEKVKASRDRYYAENREAIAAKRSEKQRLEGRTPAQKEAEKRYRAANAEKRAQWQRDRLADPETRAKTNAASAEARRLSRRLARAGLPPRSLHRVPVGEQRQNATAADTFFARDRLPAERRRLLEGFDSAGPPSRQELADWAKLSALARRRYLELVTFAVTADTFHEKHAPRVRQEVEEDSRARELSGKSLLSLDAETDRRIDVELVGRVRNSAKGLASRADLDRDIDEVDPDRSALERMLRASFPRPATLSPGQNSGGQQPSRPIGRSPASVERDM